MTDISEIEAAIEAGKMPAENLHKVAKAALREYCPGNPEEDDERIPDPVVEEPGTVRLPSFITNLSGCDVRWQGGTLIQTADSVYLRYDDGRVDACLPYEGEVHNMVLRFYHEGECWR